VIWLYWWIYCYFNIIYYLLYIYYFIVPSVVKILRVKKNTNFFFNSEELEVQIVDSNKTLMQQDCVVALQSNRQLLKEKEPLSVITRSQTNSTARIIQQFDIRFCYYCYYLNILHIIINIIMLLVITYANEVADVYPQSVYMSLYVFMCRISKKLLTDQILCNDRPSAMDQSIRFWD